MSHYKTGLYCHNIDCFSTLPLGLSLISFREEKEHSKEETVFAFYITAILSQVPREHKLLHREAKSLLFPEQNTNKESFKMVCANINSTVALKQCTAITWRRLHSYDVSKR